MSNATAPREIWSTTTKSGARRWFYYSTRAGRALPMRRADAEFELATGAAIEGSKPAWVGAR